MAADGVRLRGRQAQAARNDEVILQAAREVFLADPDAPISAVAARAGVGIGALYHRYASKQDLLRTLCRSGQETYLRELRRALARQGDPWESFTEFLRSIVAAGTHGLVTRLAGMFVPDEEQLAIAEQMRAGSIELFEKASASGQLRADVSYLDVEFLLEFLAQVQLGDAERTAELRQRYLAVIIDGLRGGCGRTPLPGEPPTWQEQTARWVPRSAGLPG
jgi:AcrR family transcriptional regulator